MLSPKGSALAAAVLAAATLAAGCGGNSASSQSSQTSPSSQTDPNLAAVATLTSLPAATLDAAGSVPSTLTAVRGQPPLSAGGKPEMFYAGAEFCPYCAAERWPVIIALSRFGTFSGLRASHSSPTDTDPSTPTWTFRDAGYRSDYLVLDALETKDIDGNPLRKPTDEQKRLIKTYDAAPYVPADGAGSIPFLDLGNRYVVSGAGYDPGVLAGLTQAQIVAALADPKSPVAQAILPVANQITAALCVMTDNADHQVCADPHIAAEIQHLG